MGVRIETALRWEQDHEYQIPAAALSLPPEFRQVVDSHFATARTKDWDVRLKEYWALQDHKLRDTEKYGKYQWREIIDTDIDPAVKLDPFSLYRAEQAEPWDLTSYELRSTIEMCRQMRRDEFHGFLSLPVEIRDIVYGYVLCKGRVIVPNSGPGTTDLEPVTQVINDEGFFYKRYRGLEKEIDDMEYGRAPNPLGLLQGVSRSIHDEAARIYFGGNHFIFPTGSFERPTYCNLLDHPGRATEGDFLRDVKDRTNNALLLRDVSYTFDMRDHPTDDHANLRNGFMTRSEIDSRRVSPRVALQVLHDQKAMALELDWAERIDSIKRMTLDRLLLTFDECYCAVGCCRKVEWVLDRFLHKGPPPGTRREHAYSSIDWRERPPLVIEVLGLVGDEESMVRKKLQSLRGSEFRFGTTLFSEDDGPAPESASSMFLL
ncbi:hypothetical protein diail_11667 [Diaporthe ilicicola]|nr:hypothetical protein diail_11667 [Diaporthe ilicicola]